MLELGRRHAEFEADCDIDGTLATMIESPVDEFVPARLRMEGAAIMRRYCENLLNVFVPNSAARLIEEWGSERSATRDVGN